jgi:hypothetical protein
MSTTYKAKTGKLSAAVAKSLETTAFTQLVVRYPLLGRDKDKTTDMMKTAANVYPKNKLGTYWIDFCGNCAASTAAKAMQTIAAKLKADGIHDKFTYFWLDLEGGTWKKKGKADNCAYIQAVVKELRSNPTLYPWKIGIYSGVGYFLAQFGKECHEGLTDLPFWYAKYSGHADFSDWNVKPYGSRWSLTSRPFAHQFKGTHQFCTAHVDFNVYATVA